jgi:phosphatidylglycerol lysyltransferase
MSHSEVSSGLRIAGLSGFEVRPIAVQPLKSRWLTFSEMTADQRTQLADYAFRYGSQYDSYLAVDAADRRFFFASSNQGIVSAVLRGRRMGAFGGILGPPEFWPQVIAEYMESCLQQRFQMGFFAADEQLTAMLRQKGFRANKFGEGAIVDLAETDWKGRKYEWVRRQTSYCQRQGLLFQECLHSEATAEDWSQLTTELLQIENLFLADRSHGSRLRHVVGEFAGKLSDHQRLFIAKNSETQQIEAFVICNPSLNGRRWVLECFRRRPDATRGVISFLLHQIMVKLQTEGVAEADLCMVPFVNCQKPLEGDHALSRKTLTFIATHLNWIYDTQGLYHFKSRFRPEFRDLHVCVYPSINVGWINYIVMECGFLNIRIGNVMRQILRHITKRRERANMANS